MDAVPHLGAKDVVDEPVLGYPAEALEPGGSHNGVEMLSVALDFRSSPWDPGLDTLLQLLGSCNHAP